MSFYKELNSLLRQKSLDALEARKTDEKPRGMCILVALDGLLRGVLPQELYENQINHSNPGCSIPFLYGMCKRISEIRSTHSQIGLNFECFSGRGDKTYGYPDFHPKLSTLSNPSARGIIEDKEVFGVIMAHEIKHNGEKALHCQSLVPNPDGGEKWISIDTSKRGMWTELISKQEGARLLRRAQRKGLVIKAEWVKI